MAIDQWKLKFYLDSQKDYTSKNFCMFLKSLDSTEIFTNERGVETIAVNEEIYLNFSSDLLDDFTSFELSNIVFHKRVTISNKNNIRITFYNSEARDSFHLSECKGANLAFNGTNIFKANFMVSGSEFENVIINSYLQVDSEMFFIGCVFKDFKVTRYQAPNIEPQFTLEFCHFENKVNFMNFVFGDKMRFKQCTFKDNVYFNNSIFKDSADFSQCEFEKTANFYGVEFKKVPNFSQTQFKGSLNVVNTNLDFDFESLKEKIKQEHRQQNTNSKKSLVHFVNDFRDSFRGFKNALIKDNNLLDASEFHRCELYCKELELDSKENKTIKDKVEKWQLWVYHKLCDHHTDLVLNLKWLVYTIALYVFLLGKIPFVYPVAIFIFCVYGCMCSFKNIWLVISSVIVFITILNKPKIILGISNLFEKDLNLWQNFITTLYVIAIGLVLFSLQKTARKNSIVPN